MVFYSTLITVSVSLCMAAYWLDRVYAGKRNDIDKTKFAYSGKILYIVSGLVVFLSMALRYGVGTDYFYMYVPKYYYYLSNPEGDKNWEPIFDLLYKGLIRVTSNPQWVFVVTGAVIVLCIWYTIYKLSPAPWLSVLFFFISRQYFISLNIVRQYTGLAIVCIGFIFLKERKYWGYVLCAILGTMCHYSTAIYLPLLALAFVKIKPVESVALIGVVSVFSKPLIKITRWIVSLTPYARYLDSRYDLSDRYQAWTIFEMIFVFAIISMIVERKPFNEDEQFLQFLYNLEVICVLFSFNLNMVPNADRISWSLEMPSIILLPNIIKRSDSKRERVLIVLVICVVYIYIMNYRIFVLNDHETVPYQIIPAISVLLHA